MADNAGFLASVVCLGAAIAVKRGGPTSLDSVTDPITGRPLLAATQETLRKVHDEAVEMFKHASPAELDHAIALYTAQLRELGWSVEAGYDH